MDFWLSTALNVESFIQQLKCDHPLSVLCCYDYMDGNVGILYFNLLRIKQDELRWEI